MLSLTQFHRDVLDWYTRQGRKTLPWQKNPTPYRVWLSEVMLQQTQVNTVKPYFQTFTETYPNIDALAAADLDDVLRLWAGLGYYSRARNLHRTAQLVVSEHNSHFPDDLKALEALPGIGRSTAGAIRSLAFNQPAPILDGNVKRVFARLFALEGWPGTPQNIKKLWELAKSLVCEANPREYSQVLMDIGALICLPQSPLCDACPIQAHCQAFQDNRTDELPHAKPKKKLPHKTLVWCVVSHPEKGLLLQKRDARGLWGGLWGLPGLEEVHTLWPSMQTMPTKPLASFQHLLTHWRLSIEPCLMMLPASTEITVDKDSWLWYNWRTDTRPGVPTPVNRILEEAQTHS